MERMAPPPHPPPPRWGNGKVTRPAGNLLTRTLSTLILGPVVLLVIWLGGWPFQLLLCCASLIMYLEWKNMILRGVYHGKVEVKKWAIAWLFGGALYVIIPSLSLLFLRTGMAPCQQGWECPGDTTADAPMYLTFWLLLIVWATDIGAYAAGRTIGGPKLAPSISPKKTWAGFGGGMLAAALTAWLLSLSPRFSYTEAALSPLPVALGGALFAVISQAGDLFESWVKRRFGVKDSGNLIPGHGGLLDRVDGLMFAAPALTALIWIKATA
jgi:phosphatidate cytidylyltransferase